MTLGGAHPRVTEVHLTKQVVRVSLIAMLRLLFSIALLAACAAQESTQEQHLQESGSAVVLAHSTFAHGYRHGYDEGYHAGNIDINMGRAPRGKLSNLRDVKVGYSPQFGPRALFDRGFQAGLKAGYNDGYMGRAFRAVENLRAVADSLEQSPSPADPGHVYFDQGFVTGYNDGYSHGGSDDYAPAQLDFHHVSCGQASRQPGPGSGSYCEGYQRGFALGHADGFALRPGSARLEASK